MKRHYGGVASAELTKWRSPLGEGTDLIAAKWTYPQIRVRRPGVMKEIRELTDCEDGFLNGKRFLINWDAKFSPRFKAVLADCGIETLLTTSLAANMNAFAAHYHEARSHQGIGNESISAVAPQDFGNIEGAERLGGLLKYGHRRTARARSSFRTLRTFFRGGSSTVEDEVLRDTIERVQVAVAYFLIGKSTVEGCHGATWIYHPYRGEEDADVPTSFVPNCSNLLCCRLGLM